MPSITPIPPWRSCVLLLAIAVSWLIALPEYALQVPANRVGRVSSGGPSTLAQLNIFQEAITMTVFGVFTILVMGEKFRWTDIAAFALVFAGVTVAMLGRHHNVGAVLK